MSKAEVIRLAIDEAFQRPKPRGGLFASQTPCAERADDLFEDFGDR